LLTLRFFIFSPLFTLPLMPFSIRFSIDMLHTLFIDASSLPRFFFRCLHFAADADAG